MRKIGKKLFILDIYGKIAADFELEFEALIEDNAEFISYCGCRNAEKAIDTLSGYFALLFPTFYEGEGVAGTLLDAFAAELPAIVNDWKYNSEVIRTNENGLIYPFRDIETASDLLIQLYRNPQLYKIIQSGCRKSAEYYSTQRVMELFDGFLR